MADVDPIIAQNIIESQALFQDSITDKIFLSPLAEKQWREDFSEVAQASKVFTLFLSKNNEHGVYVTSLIMDGNIHAIEEDDFFLENYFGEKFMNYRGACRNGNIPMSPPIEISVHSYDYSSRVYYSETDIVYLNLAHTTSDIANFGGYLIDCFRSISPVDFSKFPRLNPEGYFDDIASSVKLIKTRALEDQELNVRNKQKDLKQHETALEGLQSSFNKFFETEPVENLESQINSIKKFPAVKEIKFAGDDLLVYTDMLDIGVTDKSYDSGAWADITMPLGKFEIKLELKKIFTERFYRSNVWFNNLTEGEKGSGLIHPHIQGGPNGACLSQWEENFIQAGYNFSVIGLVSNAINYLRTFNPEDEYGSNIFQFSGSEVFEGITPNNEDHYEFENGDYNRPGGGGEWSYYGDYDGGEGEWRDGEWYWREEEFNGEYRNFEWVWYDEVDSVEGEWDRFHENFIWYEDDPDWILDNYGDWVNAASDEDYQMIDGEWTHVDEIEAEQEEVEV